MFNRILENSKFQYVISSVFLLESSKKFLIHNQHYTEYYNNNKADFGNFAFLGKKLM